MNCVAFFSYWAFRMMRGILERLLITIVNMITLLTKSLNKPIIIVGKNNYSVIKFNKINYNDL